MRPRKRILLITNNDALHEQYSLLLHIWGYAILTPETHVEPDGVVAVQLAMHQLTALSTRHHPAQIVALVHREIDIALAVRHGADRAAADNSSLREMVRQACVRKRGPRPVQRACTFTAQVMERVA